MEAITITLDGREVSGYPGMTVLDLARESGVEIPTLCHDSHLAPSGACRLCIVEDERSRALLAACVAPIAPGMVINTHSPRVMERRRTIIKLILASHPDSCLVCDKGNRCELRAMAAQMGIGTVELQRIPLLDVIEEVNPFIERDLSKCILCARCIRADQELVVEGAIDYFHRGFVTQQATLNDVPLEKSECTFCGTCVALCPTGALMEKDRSYRVTTATAVDTVCPFCGCGCGISLEFKDNRLVRARPAAGSPVNHGTLCVRGCYGYDFVHSLDRLTHPLVRVDGELQPASWEHALDVVASGLKRIREEHGADSLAVLGSSRCTNEENYLLQRLARSVLGTNNIDNGSRLYGAASRVGLGRTVGFPGTTSSIDELERSEVIMVIGCNPTSSAPAVGYAVKRAARYRGARLLLVDPRETKLASFAHLWLRPRVGTDAALINALAKVIIDEKRHDAEFVARQTDNFDEMAKSLEAHTPEHAETITGVPAEQVRLAARLFAGAGKAAIVYGSGITQYVTGTESVMALANLAMLTGNVGYRGGGIFALQQENNAQGACDMGSLPDFLPGYECVDDAGSRTKFEERWGGRLPDDVGLTALEMVEQAAKGNIRGMLIVGENPVASFPQPSLTRKALASLELLVVSDMFLTETAKLAAVVLPAASFAEKDGTTTNFEGRVQRVRRAIQPFGDSLPDWQIVLRLASKMGSPMPYSSPQQVMDEVGELVPSYQAAIADVPKEVPDWSGLERSATGTGRLRTGSFHGGFARFAAIDGSPPELGVEGYPLTLLSGSILYHFGRGTRSFRSSRLSRFSPGSWVEISMSDAERLGVRDADSIRVTSPAGSVTAPAKVTGTLPPGLVFMPVSFPDCPVNELFAAVLDPRAKAPAFKACAVRLERIAANG